MRFVARVILGVTAATMVAVAAPVAANATATSATSATDSWGPYFSSDHKAAAEGHVTVVKKRFKHWSWKWALVKKWVCKKDHKGDRRCEWVVKKVKKWKWEWRTDDFYNVHSRLTNDKWWGKRKCAWETFKVVNKDGSAFFKSFVNCSKHPKDFSFSGKNAAHIYVDVSRGDRHRPTGYHSGWQDVYAA
ncbi:hypothetical protein [Nonomuraea zeae]|uniref:Uncharacterized protein n=1 Tax=Nonomuraea zeae TaxID=1642303 RepID=A0A5S4FFY3_9ACTN|nr:hypothetical protein [Nonomuraea zeae]TMR18331.1 hypothetical protein ETD85_53685 [Nonomuraea zeae]